MIGVRFKHFLFQHSGALSTAVGALAVACAWQLAGRNWQLALTVAGGALSFVYFVQKQKLEELRLFKELFTEFNARYDKLQNRLLPVLTKTEGDLAPDERLAVFEYFNLCAEEHLFYRLGYIAPAAWVAWQNGMRTYLANPRIRHLWAEDSASDSFYGLRMPAA
jgi:hypothetical protein